ncbi:MAG: metallophosphoesterase [gamma proteobacterium symbiont of Ctena orbiculata]|uniref:Metallophosphoesterase family protein n=1 Tax=Candidatus Thiodiazotropha taylori TaxID=2792791 RepID=A0A944M685_9GAMM|nr:metallophosphoesterase family protein [Candidatus Thiodiazotropha taylori]PUB90138.1 MAG: metallophosphoesterase [gamma proteobacterium symbiont of Ctena orbiculata]MBT2988736.1 metallophosphoesterase family protein [Candidatus Thiodiazotropha taylori]MBT2996697.1 metallophosphoesterase family protein [Candidatus Thiodiazotropha taylori]MBT3001431.1 metallophosphoesterase family protein [Candidatus Thiodiazotropha taylori]
MDMDLLTSLERRLGSVHTRLRVGIEEESLPSVFGKGINFFHPENWYSSHGLLRSLLKVSGFYWRGRKNTLNFRTTHNRFMLPQLPPGFDGFTLLHLSDLHTDMHPPAIEALIKQVSEMSYDAVILTGDYRAWTFGDIDASMAGMRSLCSALKKPVYAVLGNHDTIRMVPELEAMDIQVLLNESLTLSRGDDVVHLAGVDDAHYYKVDNIEKAAEGIPLDEVSILLSHTPEIYRQAAHSGFDLFFCGHTHGGQICLPGGYPITLDARCPRRLGFGYWQHGEMQGYTTAGAGTSIVEVRINCPPEIALHTLVRSSADAQQVEQA